MTNELGVRRADHPMSCPHPRCRCRPCSSSCGAPPATKRNKRKRARTSFVPEGGEYVLRNRSQPHSLHDHFGAIRRIDRVHVHRFRMTYLQLCPGQNTPPILTVTGFSGMASSVRGKGRSLKESKQDEIDSHRRVEHRNQEHHLI